ncbi:MAG: 3-isopropylmalate dehydrogenase [Anaerolineales bacterium]|jgi:3-isopropylmalate dehydrogenase
MRAEITLLPGDGIGPEVLSASKKVLETIALAYDHTFLMQEFLIGGCAINARGTALPGDTLQACQGADAVLLGAVGGPEWDDPQAKVRPEQGLLGLRKEMGLFANLRPVKPHPALLDASPLRAELLEKVDLLVVRELTGGIYFGIPRHRIQLNGEEQAVDTMTYTPSEISRVSHLAFQLARQRRYKVTCVDKANVLECSRLWRQTVTALAPEYPDVALEFLLVDAAAMHLLTRPATFDVILTANLFGDILTDEASVLSGSMGNLASASIGESKNGFNQPKGVYEPIHGSAPDIAGKGIANPIGMILSAAMLVRHSLGLEAEAGAIETAVNEVIAQGERTPDLGGKHTTTSITEKIIECITKRFSTEFRNQEYLL